MFVEFKYYACGVNPKHYYDTPSLVMINTDHIVDINCHYLHDKNGSNHKLFWAIEEKHNLYYITNEDYMKFYQVIGAVSL